MHPYLKKLLVLFIVAKGSVTERNIIDRQNCMEYIDKSFLFMYVYFRILIN